MGRVVNGWFWLNKSTELIMRVFMVRSHGRKYRDFMTELLSTEARAHRRLRGVIAAARSETRGRHPDEPAPDGELLNVTPELLREFLAHLSKPDDETSDAFAPMAGRLRYLLFEPPGGRPVCRAVGVPEGSAALVGPAGDGAGRCGRCDRRRRGVARWELISRCPARWQAMPERAEMVCKPDVNPLSSRVTNWMWFAKNACDFNGEHWTTNLGVRSSNLFGRATSKCVFGAECRRFSARPGAHAADLSSARSNVPRCNRHPGTDRAHNMQVARPKFPQRPAGATRPGAPDSKRHTLEACLRRRLRSTLAAGW
jgi:hypothetical protein